MSESKLHCLKVKTVDRTGPPWAELTRVAWEVLARDSPSACDVLLGQVMSLFAAFRYVTSLGIH